MEDQLITYKKFNDIGLADALANTLKKHNIVYRIQEESFSFNPRFIDDELAKEFAVKIHSEDFNKVSQILIDEEAENIKTVSQEHYLFDFTNDELMEVLVKADEWSAFDHQLARKIMHDRGVDISEEKLAEINNGRIEELKQPEAPQTTWIILGYMCAILGGVLGIFIGWHLSSYQRTLPNGEKVFGYSNNDRKNGSRIFYLGIIMLILTVVLRLITNSQP